MSKIHEHLFAHLRDYLNRGYRDFHDEDLPKGWSYDKDAHGATRVEVKIISKPISDEQAGKEYRKLQTELRRIHNSAQAPIEVTVENESVNKKGRKVRRRIHG